jgi:hypothetical protein
VPPPSILEKVVGMFLSGAWDPFENLHGQETTASDRSGKGRSEKFHFVEFVSEDFSFQAEGQCQKYFEITLDISRLT